MTSSRYAEALASTLVWLEIDRGGWGAVISPPSEQRELASYLTSRRPDRPVIELGASATPEWFAEVVLAAAPGHVPGAFVVLAPDLDEVTRKNLLVMLNGQRDRTSNHGVWLLIISPRELEQVRRHAPDLASVFSTFEIVSFVPRPMTDDEVRAARAELHAHYRRRFGRLDLRGFIRSEQEDVSFPVEAIFQPLCARHTPDVRTADRWPDLPLPASSTLLEQIGALRETPAIPALIVGGPGSGKSFFLRWCAMAAAREEQFLGIDDAIPAHVSLAALRLSATADDLVQHAVEALLEAGLQIGHAFGIAAQQGRVLFLLDGLDEVGRTTDAVVGAVARLRGRFPAAMVVITSRPAGLGSLPFDVDRFDLEGLDDDAIRRLLTSWCELYEIQRAGQGGAARGRAEGSQLAAQVIDSTTLAELARSPLMATIIAIVHRAGVRLPDHRVELYEHITRILVERWNQVRNQESGGEVPSLRTSDAIRLLGPVAYDMIVAGRDGAIDEASLRTLVARQLQRGTVRVISNADEAIVMFRDTLGLLVEQSLGVYGFLHKTLGEFLAAHDVVRTGALERLLGPQTCFAPAWREVLLLALGIVGTLQANDERVARAVVRIQDNLRSLPDDSIAAAASLVGGIVADDPALSSEQALSLCHELVSMYDRDASAWATVTDDVSEALSSSWRATMAGLLRARYGHDVGWPMRGRDDIGRRRGLSQLMRRVDLPVGLYDCELLTACLLSNVPEASIVIARYAHFESQDRRRWSLPVNRGDAFAPLVRHGAASLVVIRGRRVDGARSAPWPYELVGDEIIMLEHETFRSTVQIVCAQPPVERRRALVPAVLAAWRELAAKYPDGPRPPASVEEAIAIYGPAASEEAGTPQ